MNCRRRIPPVLTAAAISSGDREWNGPTRNIFGAPTASSTCRSTRWGGAPISSRNCRRRRLSRGTTLCSRSISACSGRRRLLSIPSHRCSAKESGEASAASPGRDRGARSPDGRDPRDGEPSDLRSESLRRRAVEGRLADPLGSWVSASQPGDPIGLSARIDIQDHHRAGGTARRSHRSLHADAVGLQRRVLLRQSGLSLPQEGGARQPGPPRCDRPLVRRLLLPGRPRDSGSTA